MSEQKDYLEENDNGLVQINEKAEKKRNLKGAKVWFILLLFALLFGFVLFMLFSSDDTATEDTSYEPQSDPYTETSSGLVMPTEAQMNTPTVVEVNQDPTSEDTVIDVTQQVKDPKLEEVEKENAKLREMLKALAEERLRIEKELQANADAEDRPPTREELVTQSPMMASDSHGTGVKSAGSSNDPYAGLSPEQRVEALKAQYGGQGSATTAGAEMMEFKDSLETIETPKVTATALSKYDMSLMIPKGSSIDCILETKMDSTVPGLVKCSLPRDVYSMNGRVKLLERGSTVTGEYRGAMSMGVDRLFVMWSEILTPKGIRIQLGSPAAGALGEAGMGGMVDHHWFRRFGSALLFSMISDSVDMVMTNLQDSSNDGDITYNETEDGMNSIIDEALRQSGQIRPTLIKNQGERVSIMVARDLSFSSVYKLENM